MTTKSQQNRTPSLFAKVRDSLRATAEASVRIAYDKPWLRDARRA